MNSKELRVSASHPINHCMYTLKGIACIGVVIMHCGFPTAIGDMIRYFFKFAVPVFFMISGYFSWNANSSKVSQKIIKHLISCIRLLIEIELFYGIVSLITGCLFDGHTLTYWFSQSFPQDIWHFFRILWHGSFFNGTMWFMYAMIWGYVFLYVINRFQLYRIAYIYSILALLLHVIIRTAWRKYGWAGYDASFFRNALVYGLPFLLWGYSFHELESQEKLHIKNPILIAGFFIGIILTILEYLITKQSLDIYLGTLLASVSMFLFAILNPDFYGLHSFEWIGQKLSMMVYALHMFCISMIEQLYGLFHITSSSLFTWLKPIFAIVLSLLLALLWESIKQLFFRKTAKANES